VPLTADFISGLLLFNTCVTAASQAFQIVAAGIPYNISWEGKMRRVFLTGLLSLGLALPMAGLLHVEPVKAEDAASFYKGKKIKFIVPYKPGGGYDDYARLLAPVMEKYTGADIEILNKGGAGGMTGANEIFRSPGDGLTIGIINGSAMITNELAEIKGAAYKVAEYSYLGRVTADTRVMSTSVASGFNTYDSLKAVNEPFKMGATGLGGSTYVDTVIIGKVFEFNQDVIHGFDRSGPIRKAMKRGDVVGMWGSWGSARKTVKSGDNQIVMQSGKKRHKDLPDTPTIRELAKSLPNADKAMKIIVGWEALSAVGRPIAGPPGIPADRLAFLRDAFAKAVADDEFLGKAKKAKRAVDYASGDEMTELTKEATDLPDAVRPRLISAIRGEL
jgi:tripartite-type tricarboxylate transporter receptor subunit TctC